MRVAQGHAHQIATIGQVGHESGGVGIFGYVVVQGAVFGLTDQTAVNARHLIVIIVDDQIGLLAVLKEDMQAFSNPLGTNVVRRHLGFHVHQLVFVTRLGLNDDGLALCTRAFCDVGGLIDLVFASHAEQLEFLRHGVRTQLIKVLNG